MSTGRSPYPSRNRRRSSLEPPGGNDAAPFTSPLVMSNLLSSTAAASQQSSSRLASPTSFSSPRTRASSRRFTFGDDRSRDGGVLGGLTASAMHHSGMSSATTATATTTNGNKHTPSLLFPTTNTATPNEPTILDEIPVLQLRNLALNCKTQSPAMAVFYAGVAYTKTKSISDALLYAECLHVNQEDRRCINILSPYLQPDSSCNLYAILLATQALATMGEWPEALELLENLLDYQDDDDASWTALAESVGYNTTIAATSIHPVSLLCWYRGRAYDEMGHPTRAAVYWARALKIDPKCVQAFQSLMDRNVMAPHDALKLVASLPLDENMEWLRRLYLARVDLPPPQQQQQPPSAAVNRSSMPFRADASSIHMAGTPSNIMDFEQSSNRHDENNQKMPATTSMATATAQSLQTAVDDAFDKLWSVHKLHQSPEALALAANRCYRRHDLRQALHYCQQLAALDPLCPQASLVHVATLLALDQKRVLFGLAHEWVEASPKAARSWFAVGSYYYACGRYHAAQKHYCRATRLNPQCTEAWIAFGCSFAACDESDQALAAFRAAQRLAPAQHVPLLYMGMEYLRTNHLVLAQHFLTSAYKASGGGGDPLCLHELGVAAYQRCDYATAIVWLSRALQAVARWQVTSKRNTTSSSGGDTTASSLSLHEAIDACQDEFWEPTLYNLGHCYRRTRQFEEAAYCFQKCLALCPGNASTFTALGFTKHLQGDIDCAIELYHQALSRKPDDPFSSEMLNRALQEALTNKMTVHDTSNKQTPDSKQQIRSSQAAWVMPSASRGASLRQTQDGRKDHSMSIATDGSPSLSLDDSGVVDVDMNLS